MNVMVIKIFRLLFFLIAFTGLTVLTQCGGIVLLLCLVLFSIFKNSLRNIFFRIGIFIAAYLGATFLIVPFLARQNGRVPLPVFHQTIQPVNIWFCLLNRHYVTPGLKGVTVHVAEQMQAQFPGTKLTYLDANFPFWNGFPLLPHRSHDDGEKLDIAFYYLDRNEKVTNQKPSWTGYGVFEAPRAGEIDQPNICLKNGHWQYDINKSMAWFVKKDLSFDAQRTKTLVQLFAKDQAIRRIFIEPHLKQRLKLTGFSKIRFHGCRAARHDDHIHVEL